ncbi:MAG: hypothetical protein EOM52_08995 [Clostridia bacterium]|nr:hypothetical protein [Clostridia bacterium]
MDMNTLIDQILARVAEKVSEAECAPCGCGCGNADQPKLLILTHEHGEHCHQMLESEKLRERYATECALLQDYQVDMANYEAVILYGLSNDALGKIAAGVCDTPFTCLASQAILMGKRIFVPTEEVELYRYASTAPAAYYAMMEEKLKLLTASGVVICSKANLEGAVLSGAPAPVCGPCSPISAAPKCAEKECRLSKKVITERDISAARESGASRLVVGGKAILTDLARDMAKTRGIEIVRE